jgi:hypothetical protein
MDINKTAIGVMYGSEGLFHSQTSHELSEEPGRRVPYDTKHPNREVVAMGILLILLGLAAAGLVADFVVENDLTTAPSQTVDLLGGSYQLSLPESVLGAAALGALAVVLVILGLGLLRGSWGRRKALKRQIADLRLENTNLRSKVNLGNVARRPSQEGQADAGG